MDADVPVPETMEQTGSPPTPSLVHLRVAGVSLLVRLSGAGPVILHWGGDLGGLVDADLDSLLGYPVPAGPTIVQLLLRTALDPLDPELALVSCSLLDGRPLVGELVETAADTLVCELVDAAAGLRVDLAVQVTPAGLVRARAGVSNDGGTPFAVERLDLFLPLPESATHLLELDGPPLTRTRLGRGALSIDHAPGAAVPGQLVLGTSGTGYAAGQAWQVHVAFSGQVRHRLVGAATTRHLGGGERLRPGEVVVGPGESYHSPWVCWSTADGLDAAAARCHAQARSDTRTGVTPDPMLFDAGGTTFAAHDPAQMITLAEYAAAVGAEAFCVDLDWCLQAGLNPDTDSDARGERSAENDLSGFWARVRDFDLLVGLSVRWESLLGAGEADLGGHDRRAMVQVWERLTKLLDRHPVDVLRWSPSPAPDDRAQHARTLSTYRLLDAVRERYPALVVTTSGHDLALAHRGGGTDASVDAVQRFARFPALSQLLPPEVWWQVVPDQVDDGTSAGFRAASALFGRPVLAMDLPAHPAAVLRLVYASVELSKQVRLLVPGGRLFRSDSADAGFAAHGVLAADGSTAVLVAAWSARAERTRRLTVPGLIPEQAYRVDLLPMPAEPRFALTLPWPGSGLVLSGSVLATLGLPLPAAPRGAALVLRLTALDAV